MIRFWSKVDKNGPVPAHKPKLGQCWIWTASCYPNGYGQIGIAGKTCGAHRVSYQMEIGVIPEGLFVLHKCDNRKCVRPLHLYTGNRLRNAQDAIESSRHSHGEDRPMSKITATDALEIRRLASFGIAQKEIIRILELDVSRQQVSQVVHRKIWKHVLAQPKAPARE